MPRRTRTQGDVDALLQGEALGLLLTLAESRSFQDAASRLGVSQASVSQQVQRLERLAGKPLFRRDRRGLQITREGEAVVAYARAVSEMAVDLQRQLGTVQPTTSISVGMSEDFLRTSLPSVLALFMRQHPQIDLRLVSGTYQTIGDAIRDQSVDFAVTRRHGNFPNTASLWKDRLRWNGQSGLRLPVQDPVPLVLPMAPNPARDIILDTLRAAGRTWRVHFESFGIAGVEAALEAGLGVCAGPSRMRLLGAEPLQAGHGLPNLPDVEFVMIGPDPERANPVTKALAQLLRRSVNLLPGEVRNTARAI